MRLSRALMNITKELGTFFPIFRNQFLVNGSSIILSA